MGLLLSFILAYVGLVLLISSISFALSVFNFSLRIRNLYIQVLIRLFDWGYEKCEKVGIEEDQEHSHENIVKRRKTPGGLLSTKELVAQDGYYMIDQKLRRSPPPSPPEEQSLMLLRLAEDASDYCRWGIESIVNDSFTEGINTAELESWNLLTRTDRGYTFISIRLTLLWLLAFLFRYFILLPIRSLLFFEALVFLTTCTLLIGPIPEGKCKRYLDRYMNLFFFRALGRSLSLCVTFHDPENKAKHGGICVGNHTSPIDMVTLGVDNYYALVGQKHTGILGFMENQLSRITDHLWFDRFERNDRDKTKQRMRDHCMAEKAPIMIFPEGVCVNNTTVFKFRKGCFELGVPVYPAAIKYDRRFADPFWGDVSMAVHILNLFSSWAVKADVYYLPAARQKEDETTIEFATRVKEMVALKGAFLGVDWDGTLKYLPVRPEVIQEIRARYSVKLRTESNSASTSCPPAEENGSVKNHVLFRTNPSDRRRRSF